MDKRASMKKQRYTQFTIYLALCGLLVVMLLGVSIATAAEPQETAAPQGASNLGDMVWHDLNGNGFQDVGEPGIAGVTIKVWDDKDGTTPNVLDSGDTIFATTVTSSTTPGFYNVQITFGGHVYHVEIPSSMFNPGQPLDGYVLTSGSTIYGNPALVIEPASIKNRNDFDFGFAKAGIKVVKTAGNAPDGSTLQITGQTNVLFTYTFTNTGETSLIDVVITDDNGTPGNPADDFTVCTKSGPYAPGASDTCTAQRVISGDYVNIATAKGTPADTFGSKISNTDVTDTDDAKVAITGSIGDRVWDDQNGNGIQDVGEPGIGGVTVRLLDGGGNLITSTTTDSTAGNVGKYSFDQLSAGNYIVEFVLPGGRTFSPKGVGGDISVDSNADTTTGRSDVITLAAGEDNVTVDAGMYTPGHIGDFVWNDVDKDGVQGNGELGIPNVTVKLFKVGEATPTQTVQTDNSGAYAFDNLAPGQYTVVFEKPALYVISPKGQGSNPSIDSDADPSNGSTAPIPVVSGTVNNDIDAGMYKPANTPTPTPTPSVTNTPTPTATSTPTPTPTNTPTPTSTPTSTPTHTPTPTPTPTATTGAGQPNLSVTKRLIPSTGAADGIVVQGSTISFVITVVNTGNTTLVTVPLRDTFDPTYLGYVNAIPAPDSVDNVGGQLLWNDITGGGVMQPGESKVLAVTFVTKKSTDLLPNKQTINTATVSGAQDDKGNTVPDRQDQAPVRITSPAIGIVKTTTSPTGPVALNGEIIFTIRVSNLGDTTLVQIPVQDIYEASIIQFVRTSISTPSVTVSGNNGTLNWADITTDLGDLAPGASVQFTVTFKLIALQDTANVASTGTATDENGDKVDPVVGASPANVTVANPDKHALFLPVLGGAPAPTPTPTPTGTTGGEGEPACPPAGCPVDSLAHPKGIAVHEAMQMLFISSRDTDTLIKYDPSTNKVVATAPAGDEPWDVVINEGLNEVYVSNFASGDVWVYDANTLAVKKKIAVGQEAAIMEIFPDINTVAVVVRKLQSVAIIQNGNVVQYVPSGGTGPYGLTSDQVNKQLIVTNRDTGNAWVIYKDGPSWRLDDRSEMKDFGNMERTQPFEVAYNPNNQRVYITYMKPNGTWFVDVYEKLSSSHLAPMATIPVGNSGSDRDPNVGGTGLAINPVTNNLFVANTADGTVTVIGPNNTVKATVPVGVDPYEIAVNVKTQMVYVTLRATNRLEKFADGF